MKNKARTLTKIIWLCLINIMLYAWGILIAGCFGVDVDALSSLVATFQILAGATGLELISGLLIRLFKDKSEDAKSKKSTKAAAGDADGDWG